MRTPSAWEWFQATSTDRPIDPQAEAAFFARLRVYNGTYKTTSARRLDDVNRFIERALERNAKAGDRLQLLDVGVSSGISTLEWAQSLSAAGKQFRLVATDLTMHAVLHRHTRWFHVLEDEQGRTLQFQTCGLVFRGCPCPGDVARLKFLPIGLARLVHRAWQRLGRASTDRMPLVVGSLLDHPAIELSSDDIFSDAGAYRGRFHVVRAANLLNRSYFSREQLAAGMLNLGGRLQEGGILAVCRTRDDGSNHGSLFQFVRGRLNKIQQLGDGSDVDFVCELGRTLAA